MRRTKIVCTLGPSSDSEHVIRALIEEGMDVARLNFSHGSHDDHRTTYGRVRKAAAELHKPVAVMMDLQGPKIRTGSLVDGEPVLLEEGANFCITTRPVPGDACCVSTSYEALPGDVASGNRILMADGVLELRVEKVDGQDVHCHVVRGGYLGQHKGINLPGVDVSAPTLSEKDLEDLAFGLELGVDYVALSFVRRADDIRIVRTHIGAADVRVVAKIERPEAIDAFDQILEQTDAVMVARGDLGVEMPFEDVPQIQKELITKCNVRGKPVITATQMLESMTQYVRPTRAEVSDVAHAIYDGTDAVMLSGETAVGIYPQTTVRAMAAIAARADEAVARDEMSSHALRVRGEGLPGGWYSNAIGEAVQRMCESLEVKCIVCFTLSGFSAATIARYRPRRPIIAATVQEQTARRCSLLWGVDGVLVEEIHSTDEMVEVVDRVLLERKLAAEGDTVIIVAGTPLAIAGHTNLLKIHSVGGEV